MADIYNLYPNIPGPRIKMDFDFKKQVSSNDASTEAVLVLGTAKDGPDQPVRLSSIAQAKELYGYLTDVSSDSERKCHLLRGIHEVSEAGCNDIWAMRISGIQAELSATYTGAYISLKSIFGGVKYGDSTGSSGLGVMICDGFIKFKDTNDNISTVYYTDGVSTFAQLIQVINGSSLTHKVVAELRSGSSGSTAVTSHRPAVIECTVEQPFNIESGTNDTLSFTSIDGDDNDAAGWTITFSGTAGTAASPATTDTFYLLRGVNNVLSLKSSESTSFESIDLLDSTDDYGFFTGAELATQIQTKLNADTTLTGAGTITFAVDYDSTTTDCFTIDAGADETIELDYSASSAGETIGFTEDSAADTQAITGDTEVEFNVVLNGNDRFTLKENGQYTRNVTVAPGSYTASTLATAIGTALSSASATSTVGQAAGVFTFTSSKSGTGSELVLAAGVTDFLPTIGITAASDVTYTQGTGFAEFLDAATATEIADHITSSSSKLAAIPFINSDDEIVVRIYSMTRGSSGEIVTDADITSTINDTLGISASTTYSGQNGNLPVSLPSSTASSWDFVYMSGGDDELELTNDELLDYLADAYEDLEDLEGIDFIVPLGAYIFEDEFSNTDIRHAQNLARICMRRSVLGHFTHGVIAIEPIDDPSISSVNTRVERLAAYDFDINYTDGYYTTTNTPSEEPQLQNGQYTALSIRNCISVIAGPDFVFAQPGVGPYIMTGEAAYAGRACSLPVHSATTEKQIGGATGLYYKYGKSSINDLVGARFVCFYEDYNGIIRTVLDATYDEAGATYDNLMTYRIMATIVNDQNKIFRPYIGEAVNPQNLNAIGAECQAYLDGLRAIGVINDFEFKIVASPNASRMGEVFINQIIIPPAELKRIRIFNRLTDTI